MKSFTALTPRGPVKVHLPDDDLPRVISNGQTLAVGIPKVVPREHAEDGWLVCVPQGQWVGRIARSLTRGDTALADVDVSLGRGLLVADGLPPLWGCRVVDRQSTVTGFVFADGEQSTETWGLSLVPAPRACCGRPSQSHTPAEPQPALAFPLS